MKAADAGRAPVEPAWERVSVIICSKDRRDDLARALASLRASGPEASRVEIVIVEETDAPAPVPGTRYVAIPREGRGFGYARNRALAEARGDVLVFLDDDCEVVPGWLGALVTPLWSDPSLAGTAGAVHVKDTTLVGYAENILGFPGGGLRYLAASGGAPVETRYLSTLNCAYRRSAVEEAGGFLTSAVFGGEDALLAERVTARHRCLYVPSAGVFHRARGSLGAVFRWFVRRGRSDVQTLPFRAERAAMRWNLLTSSLLLRAVVLAVVLPWLPVSLGASVGALAVLYYGAILWRFRFALGFASHRAAWPLVPVVKLVMDLGTETGKLVELATRLFRPARRAPDRPAGTSPTILLLSNSGDVAGGGEVSLVDLVRSLDPKRFRPLVVCPGPGALAERLTRAGVAVETLRFPAWRVPRPLAISRALRGLARLVRAHGVALIHCNATWRLALFAGLVGRWTGVPMLWHVRVADPEGWKDRLLARLATAIVVNSDAVARRFAGGGRTPVHRVWNGVDLERFAPRPPSATLRARLSIPDGAPIVGSIGRFVAYKGYEHLLRAVPLVADLHPRVVWVLVGDGELRGPLETLARDLGLAERLRFVGWQDDVPEWLALFDVFVLPSLGEHFGRVLVEAMAMERPVVATAAGGVPEIVRDGESGLLVPPADPRALAAAVSALVADPERARALGRAGRARAAAEFSLARHVRSVEALWTTVIDEAGRRL